MNKSLFSLTASRASLRPVTMTVLPRARNWAASACPMPLVPPVIRIVFWDNFTRSLRAKSCPLSFSVHAWLNTRSTPFLAYSCSES